MNELEKGPVNLVTEPHNVGEAVFRGACVGKLGRRGRGAVRSVCREARSSWTWGSEERGWRVRKRLQTEDQAHAGVSLLTMHQNLSRI